MAAVLLPLLAAAAALQAAIDATPERERERQTNRLEDLAVGNVALETTGALLLGGVKALAVDFLWIHLSDLTQEHQWLEAIQVAELITKFQPRNEEVWSMLVHNLMYNIPASVDDRPKKWQYIERGIRMGEEGALRNPLSPYIYFEMGFSIWNRLGQDEVLAALYEDKRKVSPFAEARTWYEKAFQALTERQKKYVSAQSWYVSQVGLVVSEETLRGFIRHVSLQEAGWALRRHGDTAAARAAVQRALAENRRLTETEGPEPFLLRIQACCTDLLAAIDAHARLASRLAQADPDAEVEVWKAYRRAVRDPADRSGDRTDILNGTFIDVFFNRMGERLGVDRWEPNEINYWQEIPLGPTPFTFNATLAPTREDVDRYFVSPPVDGAVRITIRFPPGKLALEFTTGEYVSEGPRKGLDLRPETERKEAADPRSGEHVIEMRSLRRGIEYLFQVTNDPRGVWSREPYQVKVEFTPNR